jgi:hypothetical protein
VGKPVCLDAAAASHSKGRKKPPKSGKTGKRNNDYLSPPVPRQVVGAQVASRICQGEIIKIDAANYCKR